MTRASRNLRSIALPLLLLLVPISSSPALAVAIEVQRTTLPSTFGASGFHTIDFVSDVFVEAGVTPLVFAIPTTAGNNPCTIRFEAIRQDGFDAVCAESPGEDGPHIAISLHYIAIEPGVHSIPATVAASPTTITLAAGSISTSAVQHGCASAAACGTEGSVSETFGTTFSTAPAVLLQIQSLNSESSTPPSSASTPHLTATIVEDGSGNPIISTTGFDLALERSETQQGTVSSETVGWLAGEATSACSTLDLSSFGGPASVPFEAIITGAVIDGWDNGCNAGEGATFSTGCFSASPVVLATKRTRNEDDGGWLRRCTNGFTSTAVRLTVEEDRNSGGGNQGDGERNHVDEAASVLAFGADFSTPVTLASFGSERTARGVRFRWTTATEVAHVGFHLYEITTRRWRRLTEQPIPSQASSSLEPQTYEIELPLPQTSSFGISSIDVRNHRQDHGPFELGRSYGAPHPRRPIDWPAIRLQQEVARGEREVEARAILREETPPAQKRQRPQKRRVALEARVSRTGLYRIYYEEMAATGLDLAGVPVRSIALLSGGRPYPRRIEPSHRHAVFGPGGFLEFWGQGVEDSLYTRTNLYRIEVTAEGSHNRVLPVGRSHLAVPTNVPEADYLELLRVEENRRYSFASPNGDPWFDRRILSYGSPAMEQIQLPVDQLAARSHEARLQVELWGVTDFPAAPDHHVEISLNGQFLWQQTFDGLRAVEADIAVPPNLLREGNNELTIRLPGDTGQPFDLVHVEAAQLSYQRRFEARSDRLEFRAQGQVFEVGGWSSPEVVAYRLQESPFAPPTLLRPQIRQTREGPFKARFEGDSRQQHRYAASTEAQLLRPDQLQLSLPWSIPQGEGQLLIISHSSFLPGLTGFAGEKRAEGYSVLAVEVEAIYAHYSHGRVDPMAIRSFISESVARRGTEFVLLVGGDTYDPLDYTGAGSLSFIPAPYAQTDDLIRFTPSDALLADVDGDGFADLPIGRLPVRTHQELTAVLEKTLRFASSGSLRSAVFVADDREPLASFAQISDQLVNTLSADWDVSRVYLDELEGDDSRATLFGALAEGPTLTSFIGHSGPAAWTFDGLWNAEDARQLDNQDPTVVVQWGCWNTYHVVPSYDTLGHTFLLSGTQGAAAVMGAATLTTLESERLLAPMVLEAATEEGVTLGEAMQKAKEALQESHPERLDVLLGWTLLGDPTLALSPTGLP